MIYAVCCDKLNKGELTLNVDKVTKTGKITKKRAKNGQFFQNARLNGHARFKTGDYFTLA